MPTHDPAPSVPQRAIVYPVSVLRAEMGEMAGDDLGTETDVIIGDVYRFSLEQPLELVFDPMMSMVQDGSMIGFPGDTVLPLARHQFLSSTGKILEALVFSIADVRYVLLLGQFREFDVYTMVGTTEVVDELTAVAQTSFPRGTRVTNAEGRRVKVETLDVGDMVRTQHHGVQPVRWVGRQSVRAAGLTTAIHVDADVLNNTEDLLLTGDHRVTLKQYRDRGCNELVDQLVPLQHLVNGDSIRWARTPRVGYVHLLFDQHEVIFAEGIPVESLLVTPLTLSGLLDDDVEATLMATPLHAQATQTSSLQYDGERIAALLRQSAERQANFRRKSNMSTLLRQRHVTRPNPTRPVSLPSSRTEHGT